MFFQDWGGGSSMTGGNPLDGETSMVGIDWLPFKQMRIYLTFERTIKVPFWNVDSLAFAGEGVLTDLGSVSSGATLRAVSHYHMLIWASPTTVNQ